VSAINYRWLVILSVLILVIALLALIGAAAFVYLRWFRERATLARVVNRGLRRNGYQPVCCTRTRKCIGLEAVLRWKNVAYGLRGEAWFMKKLADRRSTKKIVAFILSPPRWNWAFSPMAATCL
jgi:sensor c-di-GMP phosphodiesterase-like protein